MELVSAKDGRRTPVVLFATPCFEKAVSLEYHSSMMATLIECSRQGIAMGEHHVAGLQFVEIARNQIVHYFLTSDEGFTDLFFIDSDEGWDPKVIPRFLAYPHGVVCGLYPQKCDPPKFHDSALTGKIDVHGLFESREAPTGFMRVRREVFERMDAEFPELHAQVGTPFGWTHTPYFQRGPTKYGVIGEDIFFSRQLEAMGESIWIDSDVDFKHRGSQCWSGNFYDHCVQNGLLRKSA
jgi:hypothetical protein